MSVFTGSCVALVTPFRNGNVDYPALEQMIEMQIAAGSDAISVCGTTGEAPTLDDDEQVEIIRFTVKAVDHRVPVIAGAGSNCTRHALYMSQAAEAAGADALLLVTPYYNRCTKAGLIAHYEQIADQVAVPCILYSVPSRTGVDITPDVAERLRDHPNIAGIKEAGGNIAQIAETARLIGDDFALWSGSDEMVVPIMSLGGSGVISTTANVIPGDFHLMTERFFRGDPEGAARIQLAAKPLIDAMFCEVNPIPVKTALAMMGLIEEEYRLPLCSPSLSARDRIRAEMTAYGLELKK